MRIPSGSSGGCLLSMFPAYVPAGTTPKPKQLLITDNPGLRYSCDSDFRLDYYPNASNTLNDNLGVLTYNGSYCNNSKVILYSNVNFNYGDLSTNETFYIFNNSGSIPVSDYWKISASSIEFYWMRPEFGGTCS
jgi:hypothetical protein